MNTEIAQLEILIAAADKEAMDAEFVRGDMNAAKAAWRRWNELRCNLNNLRGGKRLVPKMKAPAFRA